MAAIVTALGAITQIFFIFTIDEVSLSKKAIEYDAHYQKELNRDLGEVAITSSNKKGGFLTKSEWLKTGKFYTFALTYALS